MKNFYFYFLTLALLLLPMYASAEEVLILNQPEVRTYSTMGEIYYDLDGRPADKFTIEYSKDRLGFGDVYVAQKINDEWKDIQTLPNLNNQWKFTTIQLDRKATQIRLYSKGGATLTKYFRNAKATMAVYLETETATVACPNAELTLASSAVIKVSHSNMNALLRVSSDNPVFQPEVLEIPNSGVGLWENEYTFVVNFRPTEPGEQSANITITDGTHTQVVAMQAECVKRVQTIEWLPNTDIFPEGQKIGDLAKASSGLALTYTTDNPEVIDIVDGKPEAKAAGDANITATQDGNEEWEAVSATKKISVTKKEVQTITWTQDLTSLFIGDEPLQLTPSASSGLTDFEFNVENPAIAQVENGMLTPLSQGITTITARQPGNDTYAPASVVRVIRVVEKGVDCVEYVVNDPATYDVNKSAKRFDLKKPAATLSYHLHLPVSAAGNVSVEQIFEDGSKAEIHKHDIVWHPFGEQNLQFNDIAVDPKAIAIEFKTSCILSTDVSNVLVEQASYVESDKKAIVGETYTNAPYNDNFTISYSNVNDIFGITAKKGIVEFDDAVDGRMKPLAVQCGDYGSLNVKFSILSDTVGVVKDTIVFDGGNQDIIIPVEVNVTKLNQTIDWQCDFAGVKITDIIPLEATASSGLAVTFSVGDSEVASITPDNKLIFLSEGITSVVARQEGDDTYDMVEVIKQVSVKRIDPVVITKPTTEGEIIAGDILANVVMTGGEASVDGEFAWADSTLQLVAGEAELSVLFIPDNKAHYNEVIFNITVEVDKIKPVIEKWPTASNITYGQQLSASQIEGGEVQEIQGEFEWLNPDTMLNAGAHEVTMVFRPADADNIETVMNEVEVTVEKSVPEIIQWPTASDITYGQPLDASDLTGGETSVDPNGAFCWLKPERVLNAGDKQDTVVYVPLDTNISIVRNTVSVRVQKAENIILWEQDLSQLSVGDKVRLTATCTAKLPIKYVLDQEVEELKIVGDTLFVLGRVNTSVQISALADESDNYLVAVPVVKSIGYSSHTAVSDVERVEMSLYPNPVTDYLNIEAAAEIKLVRIYTASGVEVASETCDGNHAQIDFGTLPAGVYHVEVITVQGAVLHTVIRK